MSHLSPFREVKPDPFDLPSATSMRSAGPSTGGLIWTSAGPMMKMEDATVETVVTHTTRTTTSFAPIALPRIPQPESLPLPTHLDGEQYPLAREPALVDMRAFALTLGGRRVVVQEDESIPVDAKNDGMISGPGWRRTLLSDAVSRPDDERLDLVRAVNRLTGKGKEKEKKRPHEHSTAITTSRALPKPSASFTAGMDTRQRASPPRKKIRGRESISTGHEAGPLLSPLPSPEHDFGPSTSSSTSTINTSTTINTVTPSIGSGLEVAALFSLPSLVSHFDLLPDKLQQQLLMSLLRRSRMPTLQRVCTFAGLALKRDFISQLPQEVAIQILKKVDTQTLTSAARVNKRWRKMIDSNRSVWGQRLVDDGLYYGLGVEEEDEVLLTRRFETIDWKAKVQPSKAGTPTEDEPMQTATTSEPLPAIERPHVLKHVYRRRFESSRNWLNKAPVHHSFPGHGTNVVTCLQFDADRIVSASDDHSINVYDTVTGVLKKRLDGHEGGVWALQYKGDTLITGSTDRTIRIWDLDEMRQAHVFYGHLSTVRCLQIVDPVLDEKTGEYQPPYPLLVTGSRDATLRVWKIPKKGEPPVVAIPTGLEDDDMILKPEDNPYHIHLLDGHTAAVRTLAAHGRTCVSGSYDMTVRVWDLVTGQCKHILNGHTAKIYSIVYDRYRNRCASGSLDTTVKIWDVATGECLASLSGHTSLVGLLGISPNYTVSAAADASLRIWNSGDHELVHTLRTHGGAITCFQHDETKVVSGSDGTLKLWDIRTGQYIRDLVIGISSVWQVAFHGNILVAASNRGGNTVFDVFDFGQLEHQSGVDDDRLDRLRKPMWERLNPREPRTYQSDEDEVEQQPDSPFVTELRGRVKVEVEERGVVRGRSRGTGGEWGGGVETRQRRSTRLAERSVGNVSIGRNWDVTGPGPSGSGSGSGGGSGGRRGSRSGNASWGTGAVAGSSRTGLSSQERPMLQFGSDTALTGGPSIRRSGQAQLPKSSRGFRATADDNGSPTPVGGSLGGLGIAGGGPMRSEGDSFMPDFDWEETMDD